MQEIRTWRGLLGEILDDPQAGQYIAQTLKVTTPTLQRWVKGEGRPHPTQMQQLIRALPRHRQQLLTLIAAEYTNIHDRLLAHTETEIPAIFYARVLSGNATLPAPIRFWALTNLILQQALGQLDPHQQGLVLRVISCLPPHVTNEIRSLHICASLGSGPAQKRSASIRYLLGANSLAGRAVMTGEAAYVNIRQDNTVEQALLDVSNGAYPIQRGGNIAGCLSISSTQAQFFDPQREILAQHYADLLSIAFEAHQFYPQHKLNLQPMPALTIQEGPLSRLRQQIMARINVAASQGTLLDIEQVETQVWQQYENDFLEIVANSESNPSGQSLPSLLG